MTGRIQVMDGQETHIWRFTKTTIEHDGKASDKEMALKALANMRTVVTSSMAQTTLDFPSKKEPAAKKPDPTLAPKSGAALLGEPETPPCTCEKVGVEDSKEVCLEYLTPAKDCPEDTRRERNCPFGRPAEGWPSAEPQESPAQEDKTGCICGWYKDDCTYKSGPCSQEHRTAMRCPVEGEARSNKPRAKPGTKKEPKGDSS